MITFSHTQQWVYAHINTQTGVGKPFWAFWHDAKSEIMAVIAARYLNETVSHLVAEARRKAYDAGYKAGRGKQAKEKRFCCSLGEC